MIKFVNAKLNLGLNVVAKRPDGYHELETLFYPVGLHNGTVKNPEPFCDILEICPVDSPEDKFSFGGNPIDCPLENNLVFKAVKAFKNLTGIEDCFSIQLIKKIPDGAGLGGGSADATFTLCMLNEINGHPLGKEELIHVAKSLGADCPFFVENRPVIATGIGEKMTACDLDLRGCWAVMVKPDVYVSTREAFAGIKPEKPKKSIAEIIGLPVEKWEEAGLKNDFEPHIFKIHPELDAIKSALRKSGALYAAMSGSGSCIFGIFPDKKTATEAAVFMENSTNRVYVSLL